MDRELWIQRSSRLFETVFTSVVVGALCAILAYGGIGAWARDNAGVYLAEWETIQIKFVPIAFFSGMTVTLALSFLANRSTRNAISKISVYASIAIGGFVLFLVMNTVLIYTLHG